VPFSNQFVSSLKVLEKGPRVNIVVPFFDMSITWQLAATLVAVAVLRGVWVIIYRLFFYPLATVPGPLLAREFFFYSFWYNAHGGGFHQRLRSSIKD
jgi:hypothetical protein